MEATGYLGDGLVVIADDDELEWTKQVLGKAQQFAIESGFYVQKMMPKMHAYHLDDTPELRSCNLMFRTTRGAAMSASSEPIIDEAVELTSTGAAQVHV